ncbi:unnamed protein product [Coffea canephora]|uniref:DH200=94 genomic scaffold, scaffold_159 n=1 Tax=Coffea canephora TaxID=49390 RepID=A0A068V9H7_COFCA|nr:unnamed protein product [Coffea canephora]
MELNSREGTITGLFTLPDEKKELDRLISANLIKIPCQEPRVIVPRHAGSQSVITFHLGFHCYIVQWLSCLSSSRWRQYGLESISPLRESHSMQD